MLYDIVRRLEQWFDDMYYVSPAGSWRESAYRWLFAHTNPERFKKRERPFRLSKVRAMYHILRALLHWVGGEELKAVTVLIYGEDHHTVLMEGRGTDVAHSLVMAGEDNPDIQRVIEHAYRDLRLIAKADKNGHVEDPLAALLGSDFASFLMSALSDDEESEPDN